MVYSNFVDQVLETAPGAAPPIPNLEPKRMRLLAVTDQVVVTASRNPSRDPSQPRMLVHSVAPLLGLRAVSVPAQSSHAFVLHVSSGAGAAAGKAEGSGALELDTRQGADRNFALFSAKRAEALSAINAAFKTATGQADGVPYLQQDKAAFAKLLANAHES